MKYLLILTFIFFYNISNGQNCESVKTGVFTVKIKDVEFTVKRTEKREIISSKFGTVKHRIKWLSDCKYMLINGRSKLTKKTRGDLILKNSKGKTSDTIYNKIIEVNEKGFRIESSEDENLSYKIEYIYLKK
jgi:hypothetical protein